MTETTTTTPKLDEAAVRARLEGLRDFSDDPKVREAFGGLLAHFDVFSRDVLRLWLAMASKSDYPAVRLIVASVQYDLTRGKLDEGSATR